MRRLPFLAALGAAAFAGACAKDPLSVSNPNAPTVESLLGSAAGTETVISKLFQVAFIGQYGSSDAIWPQAAVMSGETEATVQNFGMLTRGGLPRAAIDNSPGNAVLAGNFRDFSFLTRTMRQSALAIASVNQFASQYDAATAARNRAFAYFTLGYSIGHMAMVYDSVSVVTPQTPAAEVPAFVGARQAAVVALAMLDTARQIAGSPAAATGTIPTAWIPTASNITMPNFTRIVRSYSARIRASMPRTADEVAGVDWAAVREDATNGLTADLIITVSPGANWPSAWLQQAAVGSSWHQMPYWYIGMADTTGAYATWINTNNSSKAPFLIRTPDRRFPNGETRAAQQDVQSSTVPRDSITYFRNRPSGADAPGGPTNGSFYDYFRYYAIRTNNGTGTWSLMSRNEVDMLAAEANIRTNNVAAAIPLINRYRTRAGLPAIPAGAALTDQVPGGNACVPRTPVRAGGNTTLQCANVLEAMKYEKRMENIFIGFSSTFFDARRWNDLISGTPIEWPVPYQETDARKLTTPQNRRVAPATNTYGWNF